MFNPHGANALTPLSGYMNLTDTKSVAADMKTGDGPREDEDYLFLSGTKVREILGKREALPPELTRPEVADILSIYYQQIDAEA
ncbi:MAG TPA: hypothetical protein EYG11_24385 [Candidatus Latescibacteria bacterium]|nr:hypothetical protein [Candidatus Handelsmanbacteria bacterium]HIL11838.1 hypothetical protein [Candidatus Latescibacterota bacterium]